MHAYFPTAEVTELAETEKEKKILPPESWFLRSIQHE